MYLTAEGKEKGVKFKNLPIKSVYSIEDEGSYFVVFNLGDGHKVESWQLQQWELTGDMKDNNV